MDLRPVTADDLAALTALVRGYDTYWYGHPENDAAEVQEWLDIAEHSYVAASDGRLTGLGMSWRTGSSLLVDPNAAVDATLRLLVPWLLGTGAPETDVLDRDVPLQSALTAVGWTHRRSSFELQCPVPTQPLPTPQWPAGVEVRPYTPAAAPRLHTLVYDDAGWADVEGHVRRDFAEWQKIFLANRPADEAPVLAYRGDRLIGAAIHRSFSDGAGYVSQLAVARDEREQGLGRALLLEAFARRIAAGATLLALSVVAANRGALALYESIGLRIDREWQIFAPAS
jgi:ribosomal protein S18 acetylase RimI-like enzyme